MNSILNDRDIAATADRFKAIAHPIRLSIVCLLLDGERTVGDICSVVGTSQPNISGHLSQLHRLGLLQARKDANRIFYAIADQRLSDIVFGLRDIYCPTP